MVRIARVDSFRLIDCPSASDSMDVFWTFGMKRRRVLLWAWLTLLPACTPLPVMLQRLDMFLVRIP
jgi:hypothetical protein